MNTEQGSKNIFTDIRCLGVPYTKTNEKKVFKCAFLIATNTTIIVLVDNLINKRKNHFAYLNIQLTFHLPYRRTTC